MTTDAPVKPQIELIGHNKTPVIYIDDYASSTDVIIKNAVENCHFSPDNHTYYPGVRSELPTGYVNGCLKPLIKHLYAIYKIPKNLVARPKDNYYSLITTEPKDLNPVQTLPHFDTNYPYLIAVIHYLNEGRHGGTAFFRHKPTQYEYIDDARKKTYFEALDNYLERNPMRELAYCTTDHEEFECYKIFDYKPNRLIIFPGYLLHSTLVDEEVDIQADPRTGRLTANMFLEFK